MFRINVPSNELKSVGYDKTDEVLEIEFTLGGIIQYFNVPEKVYVGLLNTKSFGQYFTKNIKYAYPIKSIQLS
jgi:hypothetical protein